jgi:hypothetical protein
MSDRFSRRPLSAKELTHAINKAGWTQPSPYVARGQIIDLVGRASAEASTMAALANSFDPYRPPMPVKSLIGTYTGPQRTERIQGGSLHPHHHLVNRGEVSHRFIDPGHPAIRVDPHSVSFMQQLPGVFKEANRFRGGTLYL